MIRKLEGSWTHRWLGRREGLGPEAAGEGRMRKLERLGLLNGGIFLAAFAFFVLAVPFSPPHLAALGVLAVCAGTAIWLRHRFWTVLEGELKRRKRAEQEARAAESAKGRFVADVSHEIRTPMNGVLGMTGLLLRGELTSAQRDQVEVIHTSAEALLALINDVLDLSRIEAGRLQLRPRDFRLRELAGDVIRLLAPKAAEENVDVCLDVAAGLPDDLRGDPVRLRQVLINLTGNAVRFARGGSVTVSFDLDDPGGAVPLIRCRVRDTGVGIRPEVQARLFQPFTQSDSAVFPRSEGTGLGLAISKSIVESMGGEIGFESTYGAGSTFWFRMPLVPAHGTGPVPPAVLDAAAEAVWRAARSHARVLVVDDHPVNRTLAVTQLRDLGYGADAVESGEKALSLLAGSAYDAVLLDCAMPGLDGYETCRRLRRMEGEGRRIPVIAFTAHAVDGERERCLAAGMDDFVLKPYRPRDLCTLLDRRLGIVAPVPEAGDAKVIAERLADLKRLGETTGEKVLEQVVEAYLGRGTEDVAAMEKALARGDGEALAAAAHSLAGSSGILGAGALAQRCAELDELARQGDLGACAARLPAVKREYREVAGKLAS